MKSLDEINRKKGHKTTNDESILVRYVQQFIQNIHDNENHAQTNSKEVDHVKHQITIYILSSLLLGFLQSV